MMRPALHAYIFQGGEESCVWTTVAHRHAKPLRAPDDNVCANSPGGLSSVKASKSVATMTGPALVRVGYNGRQVAYSRSSRGIALASEILVVR